MWKEYHNIRLKFHLDVLPEHCMFYAAAAAAALVASVRVAQHTARDRSLVYFMADQ